MSCTLSFIKNKQLSTCSCLATFQKSSPAFIFRLQLELGDGDGLHSAPLPHSFPQRYRVAYAAELDHFVAVLRKEVAELAIKREDTLLSSRVATAVATSFRTGQPADI